MFNPRGRLVLSFVSICFSTGAYAIVVNGPAGSGATTNWDGVGALIPQQSGFAPVTATLIDSSHLLTSAHAVYNVANQAPVADNVFDFQIGGVNYAISNIVVPTGYDSNNPSAKDIAVVTLTTPVTGHATWGYNTGSVNEMSEPGVLVGYGIGGDGNSGTNANTFPFGTKRQGANTIDVNTDNTNYNPGTGQLPQGLLVFDFDNATTGSNGPLGGAAITYNGIPEGDTTDGDSGGPMFQLDPNTSQFIITGITSDGVDPNSKFGDVGWETRVSDYSAFIASAVPEPASLSLLLIGLPFVRRRSH